MTNSSADTAYLEVQAVSWELIILRGVWLDLLEQILNNQN